MVWINSYILNILVLENIETNEMFKVLIDEEDVDLLKGVQWHPHLRSDRKNYSFFGRIKNKEGKSRAGMMHRFIMGVKDSKQVIDHINHNTLDNRKSNLRITDARGNCCNFKNHPSGYPGVTWFRPYKKWRARITIKKKSKLLGYFENLVDAASAVYKTGTELFGDKNPYRRPAEKQIEDVFELSSNDE